MEEGDNRQILQDAGLIVGHGSLAPDITTFIDNLSSQEVQTLVDLKERLDDGSIQTDVLLVGANSVPIL